MGNHNKIVEIFKFISTMLFGGVLCTTLFIFVIFSIPVYIFRFVVIRLAKVYRRDLDEILDVTSSALVNDYFTTKVHRSNGVLTQCVEGHLSTEELKQIVLKNWINSGEIFYKKFQQYPVRWLGFTFWKKADESFCIENHVHQLSGKDTLVTNEEITEMVQSILNTPVPRKQSPWEFFVVENYKNPDDPENPHSVMIFRAHHCLTDGYGTLTAFVEGLFQHGSLDLVKLAEARIPKKRSWQKIAFLVSLPFAVFKELSYILAHQFKGSPWLMPDKKKSWNQFCVRSDPISVHDIKQIKNSFQVSFTSVLLSAVSAGIHKSLQGQKSKPMLCLSVLPIMNMSKRRQLSNHITGVIFDIPTKKFVDPIARLREVDGILESKKGSVIPLILQFWATILGSHFYPICEAIIMNRAVPIGLTNFSGMPVNVTINGKKIVSSETMAGCLQGDTGVAIAVQSYVNDIRIGVTVEAGLMTKEEVQQFVKFITDEIQMLESMIGKKRNLG